MKLLPGWGDDAIMGCDLARLKTATLAARDQADADWRQRYRIAGFKIEEPIPEPEDDGDALTAQLRNTLAMFRPAGG